MDKLDAIPGYQFKDPALLARALRHRSAGRDNNERLEFLGDAVLGFIVADYLSIQFPAASEGELSRIRAALVQQATLAAIARELRIGESLILGPGELKSGGAKRDSILADALEALICAIYLDGGLETCRAIVQSWFQPRLAEHQRPDAGKDAKTRLQELMQARKLGLPVYEIHEVSGKEHEQTFSVACRVALLDAPVLGTGSSRKLAEQNAADTVLTILGVA
ncbi:MAG TPA: ribonuclease III [Pseudomonadales bacterium]